MRVEIAEAETEAILPEKIVMEEEERTDNTEPLKAVTWMTGEVLKKEDIVVAIEEDVTIGEMIVERDMTEEEKAAVEAEAEVLKEEEEVVIEAPAQAADDFFR